MDNKNLEEVQALCQEAGMDGVCLIRGSDVVLKTFSPKEGFDPIDWSDLVHLLGSNPNREVAGQQKSFHFKGRQFLVQQGARDELMVFAVPENQVKNGDGAKVSALAAQIADLAILSNQEAITVENTVLPSVEGVKNPSPEDPPAEIMASKDTVTIGLDTSGDLPDISFRIENGDGTTTVLRGTPSPIGQPEIPEPVMQELESESESNFPTIHSETAQVAGYTPEQPVEQALVPMPERAFEQAPEQALVSIPIPVATFCDILSKCCNAGQAKKITLRILSANGLSMNDSVGAGDFLALGEQIVKKVPDRRKRKGLMMDIKEILSQYHPGGEERGGR